MKKKAIEKIPYLTIPKRMPGKTIQYACVTALKNIGNEQHIFLEVYRNQKDSLLCPVVRYVATKKDWGVFFPESGEWSHQTIEKKYSGTPFWYNGTAYSAKKECQLYTEKDLDRIKSFSPNVKVWNETRWWEFFRRNEDNIRSKARDRKFERRRANLEDRIANTPELAKEDIIKWADQTLFHNEHYLYYKKHGRRAVVCCSACGGVKEEAYKAGISYESQFEAHIEEPVNKMTGKCQLCGAYGIYKPQGKAKGTWERSVFVYSADRYKEKGAVIRYIELTKRWSLDKRCGASGEPEMIGAGERIICTEIARQYFEEGRHVQKDYCKHSNYTGEDFWDDCNLYGMTNIPVGEGTLYPGFESRLKGTILQYSAIEQYAQAAGEPIKVMDYMDKYWAFPQIEMLTKLGLHKLVDKLIKGYFGYVDDSKARTVEKFLGIRKEHVKLLRSQQGDTRLLGVLQTEKQIEAEWTDEQRLALKELQIAANELGVLLQYMTIQKFLNRVSKYAGCGYGTGCHGAEQRLRETASEYNDYLHMRIQTGYDLHNTVYQYPRDLTAAHNAMVAELDKKELDKRCLEVREKYPLIRKSYRKLRNRYYYEDDAFIIRPAKSAEEIVREGRELHHCVGGNNYLEKHNNQKSIILMLRSRDTPDIPYITVEIEGTRILQWYGAYDKKPDQKNMQKWLDKYVVLLIAGKIGQNAPKDIEVQVETKIPVTA